MSPHTRRLYRYLSGLYQRDEYGQILRPKVFGRLPTLTGFALFLRTSSRELMQRARHDSELRQVCQQILDMQHEEVLQRTARLKSATSLQHASDQPMRQEFSDLALSDDLSDEKESTGLTIELLQYDHATHTDSQETKTEENKYPKENKE